MKKTILSITKAFAILFTLTALSSANQPNHLELYFFGSSTCGECLELKERVLKPLEKKHGEKLKINYHEFEDAGSFELMLRMEKQFNVTDGAAQSLFFPDTVLLGYSSISTNGRAMVEEYLRDPLRWVAIAVTETPGDVDEALREKFNTFTFLSIVAAGLVDGINPCAIATMIFLISFLATQKRKRTEVLAIGLSFTAAVFVTYLLLGVGAFRLISALDQYYWVSRLIRWSAVSLAGVVGMVSLVDAVRYKKSGSTKDITLQLPKAIKMRIHKIISGNIKGSQLIVGAIVTGFLVTLLEAVCTGQVYLPTIVLMTRSSGSLKLTGWLYLLLYNFLFVLPLLIVMVAAYFGLRWDKLAKTTQKNLTLLKVLLGIVMLGLAVYLALA